MGDTENSTEYNDVFTSNNTDFNVTTVSDIDGNGNTDNAAEIARVIQITLRPVFIVLGTVGNCLSFYVMRRGPLKKRSYCFYMAMLALADTGLLWCGAFLFWIDFLTNSRIVSFAWTDCRLSYFLYYFCRHYSSALLVIMSVEKFCALYFPLKSKTFCSVETAKRISAIIALIFAVYNFPLMIVNKALLKDGRRYCSITKVLTTYGPIFLKVDSALYSFGPFTIMTIANAAIIYKLMMAKCRKRNASSTNTQSTDQALNKSATRGTAMLVAISVTFIILTAPVAVFSAQSGKPSHPYYRVFMNIMQYLNHSINGVLYCITGKTFRNELFKLFNSKRKSKVGPSSNNTVTTYPE